MQWVPFQESNRQPGPGNELTQIERLENAIVGAGLHRLLLNARGDDQHRGVEALWYRFNSPTPVTLGSMLVFYCQYTHDQSAVLIAAACIAVDPSLKKLRPRRSFPKAIAIANRTMVVISNAVSAHE